MISDKEINEIEKMISEASPGPWYTPEECEKIYNENKKYEHPPLDHEDCDVWPWRKKEDMIFAYKSREIIPKLLYEIKQLKRNRITRRSSGFCGVPLRSTPQNR